MTLQDMKNGHEELRNTIRTVMDKLGDEPLKRVEHHCFLLTLLNDPTKTGR